MTKNKKSESSISSFVSALKWLISLSDYKSILAMFSFITMGFLQGIGLLMIVPLLSIIGVQNGGSDAQASKILSFITQLGIPLTLEFVICLFVGIMLLMAGLKYFNALNNSKISQSYSNNLRKKLHQAIIESDWLKLSQLKSADLIGILSREVSQVSFGITQIFNLTGTFIILIVHLILAFTISWTFTSMIILGSLIILGFHRSLFKKSFDAGKHVNHKMKNLQSSLQELFNNIKWAKSMGANTQQITHFNGLSDDVFNTSQKLIQQKAKADFTFEIAGAVLLSFFVLSMYYVKIQQVTDLILLIYIFARVFPGFKSLVNNANHLISTVPVVLDVQKKLDYLTQQKEIYLANNQSVLSLQLGIEFSNVSYEYPNKPIINNVNFFIPAGKITAFVGVSGSGKSTMADLVTGLLKPKEGKILIDGNSLEGLDLQLWRSTIGYMPQETFLFHDSILANLRWVKNEATEQEIWEALEKAEAKDFIKKLPNQLQTVVGDRGVKLSGGQKQRIALARILLKNPQLLILDEATNALDESNEEKIIQTLLKLKNTTIIIITHRMATLKYVQNVFQLNT